ncbi:MAG: hypothetical protein M5U32_16085 [Myxococcota bacterium]|nr:hypothetical protein [Myxococcota bacterium]
MSPVWTTRSTPAWFNSSTIRATFGSRLWVSLTTPIFIGARLGVGS